MVRWARTPLGWQDLGGVVYGVAVPPTYFIFQGPRGLGFFFKYVYNLIKTMENIGKKENVLNHNESTEK